MRVDTAARIMGRRTWRFRRLWRTSRSRRFGRTWRHGRSRNRRTAAMVMRRLVSAVLLKLHENKRHAVCLTAAAADTPCLRSRRRESAACYCYRIFTLGGQCQDNGASLCNLARSDKVAVYVGDGHVEIIRRCDTGCKIVVNCYRKPAFAVHCACCRAAVGRSAGAVRCI